MQRLQIESCVLSSVHMGIPAKREVTGSQRRKVCEALTGQQKTGKKKFQRTKTISLYVPANGGF